jgi:hypothetical protein
MGDFNIDVKDVTAGVVFSMKSDADGGIVIDKFEIGISWRGTTFKFERVAGRFTTIADLTINQVSKRRR